MRLKRCLKCGEMFHAYRMEQAYCEKCLAEARSTTIRERTCRLCGKQFPGGPRAWYCPECRPIRQKEAAAKQRRNGPERPLGSLDHCTVCVERIYCKVRQTAILPGLCSGGGAGGRQRSIETMEQGEWVLRKATAFPKKRGENLRNMRKTRTSWNAVYHMFRGMRQAAPSSLGAKCPYPQREAQNRTDNISVGQASKGKGERVTLAIGFMLGALGQMR